MEEIINEEKTSEVTASDPIELSPSEVSTSTPVEETTSEVTSAPAVPTAIEPLAGISGNEDLNKIVDKINEIIEKYNGTL